MPPPRPPQQRRKDLVERLTQDVDAWAATAGPDGGRPYLVPLSFHWDGATLLIATSAASRTARNLVATGEVHLALGHTRDVVLIEGVVHRATPAADIPAVEGDMFAVKTGFDPRRLTDPYLYFHLAPRRIRAWREVNELAGWELMRDGRWTVD